MSVLQCGGQRAKGSTSSKESTLSNLCLPGPADLASARQHALETEQLHTPQFKDRAGNKTQGQLPLKSPINEDLDTKLRIADAFVKQLHALQEQVRNLEAWKATAQERIETLQSTLQKQSEAAKMAPQPVQSEEKAKPPPPEQPTPPDKPLGRTTLQVLPSPRSLQSRASKSGASAIDLQTLLARLQKMEDFEASFYLQITAHRELKAMVKNLDQSDAFVAMQHQIDEQKAASNTLREDMKKMAVDKISPFEDSPVVQLKSSPRETVESHHRQSHRQTRGKHGAQRHGIQKHASHSDAMGENEFERELDESVWDAMILVFVEHLGWVNSVFIIFSFVAAFSIQFIFILLVQTDSFTGTSLPDLEDIETWRHTIAHDQRNIDPLARTSLASEICQGSNYLIRSTSQANLLGTIRSYREPLPIIHDALGESGHLLCIMAIAVWSLVLMQELWWGVAQLVLSVCHIPTNDIKTLISLENATGFYVLHSMSAFRKLCALVLLFCRLIITLLLFHAGLLWLAYTDSVSNLLLNCTALGLVLDVGDLAFAVILPHGAQVQLQRFKPFILPNPKGLVSGVAPPLCSIFLTGLAMIFTEVHVLHEQTKLMQDIEHIMCKGNLEFVFFIEPVSHFMVVARSSPYGIKPTHLYNHYSHLNRELIHTSNIESINGVFHHKTWSGFQDAISAGFSGFVQVSTCDDHPALNDFDKFALTIRATYGENITNCSQLANDCDDKDTSALARMVCPVSCGCSQALSGLVPKSETFGCPMTNCKKLTDKQVKSVPCVDKNLTELTAMPGWSRYFARVHIFVPTIAQFSDEKAVVQKVKYQGCQKINELWPSSGTIPGAEIIKTICTGTSTVSGVNVFCPVACRCMAGVEGCPSSCPPQNP